MKIQLSNLGKRFRKEWIFRNIDLEIPVGSRIALTGHNGSGKSTLLQLISGLTLPSEGETKYFIDNQTLTAESAVDYISFCAPYQELIEEFTGEEMFNFHFTFRQKNRELTCSEFFSQMNLPNQENKQIKYYSSGMKQRMKLSLCVFTKAEVYLLDEPSTNLDKQGMAWYHELMQKLDSSKSLLISSNIEEEYNMCNTIFSVLDYKPKKKTN